MALYFLSGGVGREKTIPKGPSDILICIPAVSHETQGTAVLCGQDQAQSVLDSLPVSHLAILPLTTFSWRSTQRQMKPSTCLCIAWKGETFSVPAYSAHITVSSFSCRLTAFVYKSFAQTSHFIYIDDYVQAQTLMWLASKQKPDGCFRSVGTLFNNALKVAENYFFVKFPLFPLMLSPITVKNYTLLQMSVLCQGLSLHTLQWLFSAQSPFLHHTLHLMNTSDRVTGL